MSLKFYFSMMLMVFSFSLHASHTSRGLKRKTPASQTERRINPRLNQKLFDAAKSNDAKKVEELLNAEEIPDVNYRSNDGMTALIWAARRGKSAAMQALITAGANLNAKDNEGWPALMWAIFNDRTVDVQVLIAAGADVNARINEGTTALIAAAQDDHAAIVQVLIGAGANVNARSNKGTTALMRAAANDHAAIVQALIGAGANVNAKDNKGITALIEAVDMGNTAIVQTLIDAGANPMLKNEEGQTALMIVEKNIQRNPQNAELRKIEKMLQGAENVWKRAAVKQRQQVQKISELPGLAPDMGELISQYAYPKLSPSEITGKM